MEKNNRTPGLGQSANRIPQQDCQFIPLRGALWIQPGCGRLYLRQYLAVFIAQGMSTPRFAALTPQKHQAFIHHDAGNPGGKLGLAPKPPAKDKRSRLKAAVDVFLAAYGCENE